MEVIFLIGVCLPPFLASFGLTYLIRNYALKKSLIDIPNARSSHSIPTPRGGGLSVVLVCLLPEFLLVVHDFPSSYELWRFKGLACIVALFMVAGIGFWDDHKHIPARWRLLAHFSAAALLLCGLWGVPSLSFFGFQLDNPWVLNTFYLFGLVWLLNLYNFMDGIDGIASIEAITVLLSASVLSSLTYDPYYKGIVLLLYAAAVAGFLVWNFPHAKIFMGDACSGFLGFVLGEFALKYALPSLYEHEIVMPLWSWLILLGLFITDATFTLIKRILNKQVWYEAHSSHAYQHYARKLIHKFQQDGYEHRDARTKSHRRVNLMLTLINIFWLLPLAAVAMFYPYWAFLITVIAYLPLIFLAHKLKAGITE